MDLDNSVTQTLSPPQTIIFDWHGTLVDTLDAMYEAMEEMLPQLEELDLVRRLLPEHQCKTDDDIKLVRYIRIFRRLHPKILAERRISRTDVFNAIFGGDIEAKTIAHQYYNHCYRNHFGSVHPFQQGITDYLYFLKNLDIKLGIATNRSREFLDHEMQVVEDGEWLDLFDMSVSANDVTHYKPDPEVLYAALQKINRSPDKNSWYVGDSYLDMVTAKNAGITAIFYNGCQLNRKELETIFTSHPEARPDAIIHGFDELVDLLEEVERINPTAFAQPVINTRPKHYPAPHPPKHHIPPDWHPSIANLTPPTAILFDWHATLVDTLDAMYHAVDDMLPELNGLGLMERIVKPEDSKTTEDARLVEYVRSYNKLHPRIKADRKISRTDIFEVLFGDDQKAKQTAHAAFNNHYRNHFGTVLPFEPRVRELLEELRKLPVILGVITNRDREFFEQELAAVEGTGWSSLFDVDLCGDDTERRKPHPDQLILATERLNLESNKEVWYVGDSTTDIIAAQRAGQTGVFFNGAQWDQIWLEKIFPGSERHPHKPDVIVNNFSEFWAMVLACRSKAV